MDILIWDTDRKVKYGVAYSIHRTDYNHYEDWALTGYPDKVFMRGNLIVDEGQWFGKPRKGMYLYLESGAKTIYGNDHTDFW